MNVSSVLLLVIFGPFSLCLADYGSSEQNSSEIIDLDRLMTKGGDELSDLIKLLVNIGYSVNKLQIISDMVDYLKAEPETPNITLIAYQNIYDEDGTIKEIRTIELALPKLEENSSVCCSDQDDSSGFDPNDTESLEEIRDLIEKSEYVALGLEFSYESMGDRVYIGKGVTVIDTENLFFANKSIHMETLEDVEEDYQHFNGSGPIPSSYLVYDKEGKFIKSESFVVPEQFVQVDSEFEQPKVNIIEITSQSLADAFLESENKNDVPEKMRQKLEEHYPELIFIVTSGEPIMLPIGVNQNQYSIAGWIWMKPYIDITIDSGKQPWAMCD